MNIYGAVFSLILAFFRSVTCFVFLVTDQSVKAGKERPAFFFYGLINILHCIPHFFTVEYRNIGLSIRHCADPEKFSLCQQRQNLTFPGSYTGNDRIYLFKGISKVPENNIHLCLVNIETVIHFKAHAFVREILHYPCRLYFCSDLIKSAANESSLSTEIAFSAHSSAFCLLFKPR